MADAPILVTGAAGFIGFHVAGRLLQSGKAVVGLDNLNAYYDPKLKDARLAELSKFPGFRFVKLDLADRIGMAALFAKEKFPYVVHLAVVREFLATLKNLQVVGRNGMHKYNNQDHSMMTALLAARNIAGARFDLWKVNTDAEYLEESTTEEVS